jgi:hypothetical protein
MFKIETNLAMIVPAQSVSSSQHMTCACACLRAPCPCRRLCAPGLHLAGLSPARRRLRDGLEEREREACPEGLARPADVLQEMSRRELGQREHRSDTQRANWAGRHGPGSGVCPCRLFRVGKLGFRLKGRAACCYALWHSVQTVEIVFQRLSSNGEGSLFDCWAG